MEISKLEKVLEYEPKYRLEQARKAIYFDLINLWEKAEFLPKDLRQKLDKDCPLDIKSQLFFSSDKKTVKALIQLEDGNKIECALMKSRDRNTVCVSTQVGCPMGCAFCATGNMGFIRNLEINEIIEQVLLFARLLKKTNKKVTNVVFMGMGEPFLNYDNVLGAIKIMNQENCFNLGMRRFSISTSGIIQGIKKLADENLEVNLAISLHSPNDEVRSVLMPIAQKVSVRDLIDSLKYYQQKTRRKIMIEYLLIDQVNDSQVLAKELAMILKGLDCMVNLIPYNETGNFKPSNKKAILNFKKILLNYKVETVQRFSYGQDIKAACGQLATF